MRTMSNRTFSHGCPAHPSTVADTSTKPAYAATSVAFDRLVWKRRDTSRFVQAPKTVVNLGEAALVALSSMVAPRLCPHPPHHRLVVAVACLLSFSGAPLHPCVVRPGGASHGSATLRTKAGPSPEPRLGCR